MSRELFQELMECCDLEEYHKQALDLYVIQGLDFQEMGAIMERDNTTVMVCYIQAMQRLMPLILKVKPQIGETFFQSLMPPFRKGVVRQKTPFVNVTFGQVLLP